jgi:hypothetical protein|tara:strand:+ start:501 stop:713 length:213 start_codon:yes stop_codon:yes gene_type:complete
MWLPIILVCAAPYVQSCNVITGLELLTSKEECFIEAGEKARILLQSPVIYQAKPACQIIPEKIKENKLDT